MEKYLFCQENCTARNEKIIHGHKPRNGNKATHHIVSPKPFILYFYPAFLLLRGPKTAFHVKRKSDKTLSTRQQQIIFCIYLLFLVFKTLHIHCKPYNNFVQCLSHKIFIMNPILLIEGWGCGMRKLIHCFSKYLVPILHLLRQGVM